MKGHVENQRKAKELFELRKEDVKRDGLDKHLLPDERLPPPPPEAAGQQHAAMFEDDDPRAKRLNQAQAGDDEAGPSSA
jgi:hypothetical protein